MAVRLHSRQRVDHLVYNLTTSEQTPIRRILWALIYRGANMLRALSILPGKHQAKERSSLCHFAESRVWRCWCLSEPNPWSTASHWRERRRDSGGRQVLVRVRLTEGPVSSQTHCMPVLRSHFPDQRGEVYCGKNGRLKSLKGPPTATIIT